MHHPWCRLEENGACCMPAALWVYMASCKVPLDTLLNLHLWHCNSVWHIELQQTANGKTDTLVSCDQPAILQHSLCKYRQFVLSALHFLLSLLLTNLLDNHGFFRLLYYIFHQNMCAFFYNTILFRYFCTNSLAISIIFINMYAIVTPTWVVIPYSKVYEAKVTLLM